MNQVRSLMLLVICLCAVGHVQAGDDTSPSCGCVLIDQVFSDPAQFGDTFDWESRTALDFLDELRDGAGGTYTVASCHQGWVTRRDVEALVELLDSTEPCANVAASWSSFWSLEPSTVGNEAGFLILGYRSGCFPPDLNSDHPKVDLEEIRQWWRSTEGKTDTGNNGV